MARTINSASTKSLKKWVKTHGLEIEKGGEDTVREITLTALRAGIKPGRDSDELVKQINRVLYQASQLGGLNHPTIASLVDDTRLPGWTRLGVALLIGDAAATTKLAKNVPALSEHAEGWNTTMVPLKAEAFNALSLSRRVRLASTGFSFQRRLRIEVSELEPLLDEVASVSWKVDYALLVSSVAWKSASLADGLSLLNRLQGRIAPELVLDAVLRLLGAHDALTNEQLQHLPLLRTLVEKTPLEKRPSGTSPLKVEGAMILTAADRSEGGQYLAAMMAKTRYQFSFQDKPSSAEILTLAHPASAWALPEIVSSSSDVFTALEAVTPWAPRSIVRELLKKLSEERDSSWWKSSRLEELRAALGSDISVLLSKPVSQLSSEYGYSGSNETSKLLENLPVWAKEAILAIPGDPDSRAARAQAVMADRLYVPAEGPALTAAWPLGEVLKGHLLRLVRGNELKDSAEAVSTAAWLRRFSARDFAEMIEISVDYNVHCSAGDELSSVLTDLLAEALDAASSNEAKAVLVNSLENNQLLPSNRTLIEYARALNHTLSK